MLRILLAAVVLIFHSFEAIGQVLEPVDLTPPPYFLLLKEDATTIVTAPLRWEKRTWAKVGIGAGAIGLVMLADRRILAQVNRNSNDTTARIANAVEPFGSDYSWAVLAGFYGSGRVFGNSRASAVAKDGFAASLIAAGLVTPAIKMVAGRSRPSQSDREYRFLHSDASFPSGHTTQAFAVAAVIADHYDSIWLDGLAYGLAGLVGYARLENDAHFASDVLAGAIIGVAIGKAVVRLNREKRQFSIEPMVTRGGAGVIVRVQ